jgi:CRISPR associated protein Cas1
VSGSRPVVVSSGEDSSRLMTFARAVVDAKVRKQIVLLKRFARRDNAKAVMAKAEHMDGLLAMLSDCGTRDECMGIEGAAAREYLLRCAGIDLAGGLAVHRAVQAARRDRRRRCQARRLSGRAGAPARSADPLWRHWDVVSAETTVRSG